MPDANTTIGSWHRQETAVVLDSLGSTVDSGLSDAEVLTRQELAGPNDIQADESASLFRLIANQFADFMIGLLVVAALVSGIIGDMIDTIAIVVIVILNAAVGAFQEFRAQRAVAALRDLSAPFARVVRNGNSLQVRARDLVAGDVVLLAAGDVVPADLRIVSVTDLGIDESAMTGESTPVSKVTHTVDAARDNIAELTNMAWRSTLVTRGKGTGIVTAIGGATEIGRIASLLHSDKQGKTPLQIRLAQFSLRIALAVLAICAIVFATGLIQGQPALLMLLTAISLAVAAVPEALPAVITVSLGLGARRLSELNALVRHLPAVESLGSVTYICADKTGTLTENRMTLGVIVHAGQRYETLSSLPPAVAEKIGWVLALCNEVDGDDGQTNFDPTEFALLEGARAAGIDRTALAASMPRIADLPFESERQCMLTVHQTGVRKIALLKGAPERVLAACDEDIARENSDKSTELAREGYRVLALACRYMDDATSRVSDADLEGDWTFLGLVGLTDPPRPGVFAAIQDCRSAGIAPVMITGDHPATAMAIARKIGLADDSDIVLTGQELARLDDRRLDERIEDVHVFARVSPEQKFRIVQSLQKKGHFVAMTGDGINDAPALRHATIGIAMGLRGTDVAREAAEMVLLDDSFSTIVQAVHEGRRIFDNIRKFIRYTMTSNSGELWVLVLAPFLGLPIPLLPLHILWINLVTDGLPGLALATEPAESNIMQRKPRPAEQGIFTGDMVGHIFWVGLTIGGLTLATQAWALARQSAHWQTMVFTVLVIAQLFQSLAVRSERYSLMHIGLFTNPALLLAIGVTLFAQLMVIYVPALNDIFKTAPLSAVELAICFGAGSLVLVFVELDKAVRRRTGRAGEERSPHVT